jgi:RNA polymerase sigma factor (sigma-70 family)
MANGPLKGALQQLRSMVAAATVGSLTDRELLERFVSDADAVAFAGLVQRHGPMVLRVCHGVLHDPHDAEDACQAALLVLARKARSIHKQISVGSWLHGVALHVAGNLRRTLARRRAHETAAAAVARPAGCPESSWRDVRAALDEELQQLPDRLRAPLVLCYLQGKTRDEAAKELSWTLATLRCRLKRGRGLLHGRLARRGLGLPAALVTSLAARETFAATLATRTVRAATALALQQPLTALVSPRVLILMQGAMPAMNVPKKIALIVMTILTFVVLGAGLVYSQAGPGRESPSPAGQAVPSNAPPAQANKQANAAEAAGKLLAATPESVLSDRLVRAYLGIGSIRTRFVPAEGKKGCVLAVAKFKNGNFVDYAKLSLPVDIFVPGKPYEAELGWGSKNGQAGYFLVAQAGLVHFQQDDFFQRAYVTINLTDNRQPEQKLGPFYVLGYTFEGSKVEKPTKDSKYDPLDVRGKIQRGEQVMVFLMRPFDTMEGAAGFSTALPKLTGD